MSYAPKTLQQLAAFYEGKGGAMLGIVGDAGHTTGYHLGRDRIYGPGGMGADDYSVRHPRDKAGLSGAAAAIDLGKIGGSYDELYRFSRWLVAECMDGAPGTGDIAEVIYSPDGQTVQRWSGKDHQIHTGPGNNDPSHKTHTHVSYFRDSEARQKVTTFAGYWEEDMAGLDWQPTAPGEGIGTVTVKAQRGLVNLRTGRVKDPLHDTRPSFGRILLAETFPPDGPGRNAGYLVEMSGEACIALDDVVESFTPDAPATAPNVLTGDDGSEYRRQ